MEALSLFLSPPARGALTTPQHNATTKKKKRGPPPGKTNSLAISPPGLTARLLWAWERRIVCLLQYGLRLPSASITLSQVPCRDVAATFAPCRAAPQAEAPGPLRFLARESFTPTDGWQPARRAAPQPAARSIHTTTQRAAKNESAGRGDHKCLGQAASGQAGL